LEELKVEKKKEKLRRCNSNSLRYVTRMNKNGSPKIMLNCGSNGRRKFGRALMRLLE
jgi:hypothetical protein